MAKKDLVDIYNTYKNNIIEELSIGVPQGGPSMYPTTEAQPSNDNMINLQVPTKEEDCEDVHSEESNIEMGKSEVFSILKNGNELMNILQNCSKLEPWQLSKLVKACDYINSVKNSIEYDEFEKCQNDMVNGMRDISNGMVVVSKIKDMLAGEDSAVNEQVLKQVIFNIECLKDVRN